MTLEREFGRLYVEVSRDVRLETHRVIVASTYSVSDTVLRAVLEKSSGRNFGEGSLGGPLFPLKFPLPLELSLLQGGAQN